MDEEIAHGDLPRNPRIPHLKPRDVLDDRSVPVQPSLLDEDSQRRRRERLRVRGDPEAGPFVHRLARFQGPDAESTSCDDSTVFHHGQRDTGHLERVHRPFDDGIEVNLLRMQRISVEQRERCHDDDTEYPHESEPRRFWA